MTIDNLKLPKCRIVAGNPAKFEPASDYHTKQAKVGKDGQPLFQNWCHVAIPKHDFINQVWPAMIQEVATKYPNGQNVHPDQYLNDRFAWKIIDGDSPLCAEGGKTPYNKKEGYAGHYIIKLSTYAFAPDVVIYQNGAYRKIDASQIKTGDYVCVSVKLEAHSDKNGGLYWNPNGYELVELGQAISSGEGGGDPNKMFGDASSRTHGGFQGVLPTAGAAPQMVPQQPMQFATPQQPMQAPAMPPPAHDFVQNATGQQPIQFAAPQPQTQFAAPQPQAPAMGFMPPAAPAAPMQQFALPQGAPIAQPVTTSGFSIPGIPQR